MNAQLLNAVRNYRPALIWKVMQRILSYLKYLFGGCVISAIFLAMITEPTQAVKMGYAYVCGSFVALVFIGAVANRFNLRKIKRECERLGVTVADWNKVVRELKVN